MKGDILPDSDHVLRYVRRSFVDPGAATGVQGAAFISRPIDENQASYNWMEFYEGEDEQRVQEIVSRSRLTRKPRDLFVKLNVGNVLAEVKSAFADEENLPDLSFVHDPLDADEKFQLDDQSHSLMINMPATGEPLAQAIGDVIAECIIDSFPAFVAG